MQAAERSGCCDGAHAGAAGSGSHVPCAHSLPRRRRTEVARFIVTLIAEEKVN